jgi:hypothetical protein
MSTTGDVYRHITPAMLDRTAEWMDGSPSDGAIADPCKVVRGSRGASLSGSMTADQAAEAIISP